jgi:lantibiotic modifying enzyme
VWRVQNGFFKLLHWLAVMRLLGGSDLHAENLIAQGGSPVVVDCETLFTPKIPPAPSELGQAFDHAAELVAGTVLSVGMLPGRGMALGWRGIDSSEPPREMWRLLSLRRWSHEPNEEVFP